MPEPADRGIMYRVALFFIPIIVSVVFIVLIWLWLTPDMFQIIGILLLSYFISPFGREVLIPITVIALIELHGTGQMVPDVILITMIVVFVDVMCSIFLLWNLDLLKHIPKVGKWIDGIEKFGRAKLKKSKSRRTGVFALLTAYVALPFQGSGGIVSTIIGMLTGMRKQRVWLSIWIGSIVGSLMIAIPSFWMGQVFIDFFGSSEWKAVGIAIMFGILMYIIMNYFWHRRKASREIKD